MPISLPRKVPLAALALLGSTLFASPVRSAETNATAPHNPEITWNQDYADAVHEARRSNKDLVVLVSSKWCGYCRKMLQQTFPNPAVIETINEHFIPVLIDGDKQQELARKFKVDSFPTLLIVAPNLKISSRLTGFQSATQLNSHLQKFGKKSPATSAR